MNSSKAKTSVKEKQESPTSSLSLYKPEKYKVYTGKGNVGFCTAWNEPKAVLAKAPELQQKAALIGTLYSCYGINIIIRNLALNPHINRFYIWGHGRLSNTKFGVLGINTLKQLWKKGLSDEGTIIGTSVKLDPEIRPEDLSKITKNVKLIDISRYSLAEAINQIDTVEAAPYMDPLIIPDSQPAQLLTFPSEKVGWVIHGHDIINTWTRVVERIMRYGTVKGTQYGNMQKELIGVTWVVNSQDPDKLNTPEDWPQDLRETIGATHDAIDEYKKVFLSPEAPKGISYTYGNRLMNYPASTSKKTLNQITESIIRNMKNSADSRRAVATTMVPWIDALSDEPPCLTQMQTLQLDGQLHLLATFRSHDIFKAAIPNALGLRHLQYFIAKQTGFEVGCLQITSQSAHVYEPDWDSANKLSDCAFWHASTENFTGEGSDPRGCFIVSTDDKNIIVELQGPEGQTFISWKSTSADHLCREISKLELFSQTGHALDIGIQLARAEIAIKLKIPFIQDRPLNLILDS